jgi:hypothetical protein
VEETLIGNEPLETVAHFPNDLCYIIFITVGLIIFLIGLGLLSKSMNIERFKKGLKIAAIIILVFSIVFTAFVGYFYYQYKSRVPDAYMDVQLSHTPSESSPSYPYLFNININNETYIEDDAFFLAFEHKETKYIEISAEYIDIVNNYTKYPLNFIDNQNRTVIKAHYRNENLTLDIIEPMDISFPSLYYNYWGFHYFTLAGDSGELSFYFEFFRDAVD